MSLSTSHPASSRLAASTSALSRERERGRDEDDDYKHLAASLVDLDPSQADPAALDRLELLGYSDRAFAGLLLLSNNGDFDKTLRALQEFYKIGGPQARDRDVDDS